MKRITALLLVIALFGGCASDCYAKTNWGFGPVVDWGFGPVDEVGDSNEFGLGIFAKQQDCPNGLCPLPGQVQMQWEPPLRPRTTITRTVTQLGVGAFSTAGLPPGAILTSVKDSNGNELLPAPVVLDCPNCPMTVDTRTVTRQRGIRRWGDWTWPGQLDDHLAGYPHYVPRWELDRMSHGEKVALHNQHHNEGVGTRRGWRNNTGYLWNGPIVTFVRNRRGW